MRDYFYAYLDHLISIFGVRKKTLALYPPLKTTFKRENAPTLFVKLYLPKINHLHATA
jgi:hypothetical protein